MGGGVGRNSQTRVLWKPTVWMESSISPGGNSLSQSIRQAPGGTLLTSYPSILIAHLGGGHHCPIFQMGRRRLREAGSVSIRISC